MQMNAERSRNKYVYMYECQIATSGNSPLNYLRSKWIAFLEIYKL